jgi:phosphate:Na+ symporter
LVIGQNIGTATSSAMAAIGASNTAKRLAVAYIAFKLIAAAVAIILFPAVTGVMLRASEAVDPVTLVAAYHTAYNAMGVIERIVPDRRSAFMRYLDPGGGACPGGPMFVDDFS